jgi:hypothetical protein
VTPSEITYVLHALAWSGIGYFAGYIVGKIGCEVHQVREAVAPSSGDQEGWPPMRRRGDRRSLIFGAFLVGLAALTVLLSAISLVRLESLTRCQANYAEQAAEATQARTRAAEDDREALNLLVRRVTDAVASVPDADARRPQVQAALGDYTAAVREADAQREAQPFPAPPSEVCR